VHGEGRERGAAHRGGDPALVVDAALEHVDEPQGHRDDDRSPSTASTSDCQVPPPKRTSSSDVDATTATKTTHDARRHASPADPAGALRQLKVRDRVTDAAPDRHRTGGSSESARRPDVRVAFRVMNESAWLR
jgi:hypothetical protein